MRNYHWGPIGWCAWHIGKFMIWVSRLGMPKSDVDEVK